MKLWAVVVGRLPQNQPYVANDSSGNKLGPLCVFESRRDAWRKRRNILAYCGHKSVRVIPFFSSRRCADV